MLQSDWEQYRIKYKPDYEQSKKWRLYYTINKKEPISVINKM